MKHSLEPTSGSFDQKRFSNAVISKQIKAVYRIRALAASLVLMSVFYSPVHAADAVDRSQAIEIAKQQNGGSGKVLGVTTTTDQSGNTVYAVKLLTNGRIRIFKINKAP